MFTARETIKWRTTVGRCVQYHVGRDRQRLVCAERVMCPSHLHPHRPMCDGTARVLEESAGALRGRGRRPLPQLDNLLQPGHRQFHAESSCLHAFHDVMVKRSRIRNYPVAVNSHGDTNDGQENPLASVHAGMIFKEAFR